MGRPLEVVMICGIANDCNRNRNSEANFPQTYNRAGEDKIHQNWESNRKFTGAAKSLNFRVLEYEVFQVLYH